MDGFVDRANHGGLRRANQPDRFGRAGRSTGGLPALAVRAVRLGRVCLAHSEHDEPVPIELHHVRPRPRGGGDGQQVQVCANAHGRIHALLDDIEATAKSSPYSTWGEVLRHMPEEMWSAYSVIERAIAYHGWQSYGLGFVGGRYETSYRYWRTDGTPRLPEVPHFNDLYHAARWSRRWRRELDAL